MTLILAMSNQSFATVLGDRLLVRNGKDAYDEANKICVLFCDDARMAVGYAGLAGFGNFKTQDWLRDTLVEITKTQSTLSPVLSELARRATSKFSTLPCEPVRTFFLFSGFLFDQGPTNHAFLLSNWDSDNKEFFPKNEFNLSSLGQPGEVIVEVVGYATAFSNNQRDALTKIVKSSNVPQNVLRKAVGIMRQIADNPKTKKNVGKQCNSAVVPREPDTPIVATYHSNEATYTAYGPDVVLGTSDSKCALAGWKLDFDVASAGPEIRKGEPCWCGSGKRYGNCCKKNFGSVLVKVPGFERKLTPLFRIGSKTRQLSGQVYQVCGSFV